MRKRKIVYITMSGDLFHVGHLELIKKARQYGNYVIVGLHPDDIIKQYKRTPIIKYEDRKAIIESIKGVNKVVEDCMDKRSPTMFTNLEKYKVDILIHGDDWLPPLYKKVKKEKICKVIQVPYYPFISTTKILQKVRDKNNLKSALKKKDNLVVISANDAITAKLVENYGFDGIWVSSFESSARMGLVDNETINLSDMINIARPIIDSVDIPVIIDADTGYGDIEQVVRAVKELEKIGASAITIEDNIFPKSNSLWGGKIPIADMKKHGAKIKAGKEAQKTDNFSIIARTEALIRGYGIEEALKRANYYADCGADLILMHSRDKTGKEAMQIPKLWKRKIPLVIIPSKFPHITNRKLFNVGYSVVIYANQTQRAKIYGVKKILKILKTKQNAKAIENYISTLDEFRNLTPVNETKERKSRYENL